MNSYSCLGIRLDINEPLFIINYYHHVIEKRPNLHHLLSLPLPTSPLLIGGDFNTHSLNWSPPDLPTSPWAHMLEDWLDCNGLMTLISEGSLTHQGMTGHPSLLDHIFINMAFLKNPVFPVTCSVSFKKSISSDHAALFLDLPLIIPPPPPPSQTGWIIKDHME